VIHVSIVGLKKDLESFRAQSAGPIAKDVATTGFTCKRCGKCCRSKFGDNTVTVFPSEVRAIMEATGMGWLDVARPHESDDVDSQGLYHTFEWALCKKNDGDCAFLEGGKCAIYQHRPLICRTYPMRLEGAELELYECDGLGTGTMGDEEARAMAGALLKRQVVEAEEAISLLEKYEAYRPSASAYPSCKIYVVHDSEGSRKVAERSARSFYFI
jgi:Fe-S-cluster containining protein